MHCCAYLPDHRLSAIWRAASVYNRFRDKQMETYSQDEMMEARTGIEPMYTVLQTAA
jgi:hypothetical protein